jgi:hypothetical protein
LAGKGRERLKTKDKRLTNEVRKFREAEPKNERDIEVLSCGINSGEIPLQRKWVSGRRGIRKRIRILFLFL